MATWQQGINSGGFLAGIGAQNENAPKASDINATLGLIRENNELARSGANNVGLTALRGLAGVADIYNQEQQQKAISAFNKVHADAWASGDPLYYLVCPGKSSVCCTGTTGVFWS